MNLPWLETSGLIPFVSLIGFTAFVDVSLSRSRLFDGQRISRLVVSLMISFFAVGSIESQQLSNLAYFAAYSVAGGISVLLFRVLLQRGRTESEEKRRWEERRMRTDSR